VIVNSDQPIAIGKVRHQVFASLRPNPITTPPMTDGKPTPPMQTSLAAMTHASVSYLAQSTSTTMSDAISEKSPTFLVKTGRSLATAVAAMSAS
jgi:hypothetical protein